jgi:hypothetical protein
MPFRSPSMSYLVIAVLGMAGTSTADVIFQLSGAQVEEIVKIIVQALIGAVTIFNLIERRKRARNTDKH